MVDAASLEPGPAVTAVSGRNDAVYLWVRLRPGPGAREARVSWYDPAGRLHLDSGPTPLPPAEAGQSLVLCHRLPVRGATAAALPGRWRVIVRVDGRLIEDRSFMMERGARRSAATGYIAFRGLGHRLRSARH
jgi:hypothetical protein